MTTRQLHPYILSNLIYLLREKGWSHLDHLASCLRLICLVFFLFYFRIFGSSSHGWALPVSKYKHEKRQGESEGGRQTASGQIQTVWSLPTATQLNRAQPKQVPCSHWLMLLVLNWTVWAQRHALYSTKMHAHTKTNNNFVLCMCVSACVCVFVSACICVSARVCLFVSPCMRVLCTRLHLWVGACMCTCVWVVSVHQKLNTSMSI